MTRLSRPLEEMRDHYDVVVIGSGYGGGISASRLARAGRSVCLLERGPEKRPGEYPNTTLRAQREMNIDTPDGHVGNETGMFNFHVNKEMNALVGCGLGGTSLINANVSLKAERRIFDDPRWPKEIRDDADTALADAYRHAEAMLQPKPYPVGEPHPDGGKWPSLKKTEAHETSAKNMDRPWYRLPINVTFEDGVNHVGVEQRRCTLCGDCVSGCNEGAKNTTLMNYIPDAYNHGAEIFCEAKVRYVERTRDRWTVHFEALGAERARFDAPTLAVTADVVVLAAGTLGSTEILLRSREQGLTLSPKLGERFTGNGDVLGFSYDTKPVIHTVGWGHEPRSEPVGPCITSVIDMREQRDLEDGLVIEEGSIPGALGPMFAGILGTMAGAQGAWHKDLLANIRKEGRWFWSLIAGPRHGVTDRTQTFLIMSNDRGDGRMVLEKDRLRIVWPGIGGTPTYVADNETLKRCAEAIGGLFLKSPIWNKLLRHSLITVHPLGGCAIGADAGEGVVDHKGRVFAGDTGVDVHDGLYVADGAIIPRPVGVNPLLTISALAERNARLLAQDRGWTIDYSLPSRPPEPRAPDKPGIQFTEKMAGYVSTKVGESFEAGEAQAKADGSSLSFVLTVASDDVDDMIRNPEHEARMYGTVSCDALSAAPLRVHRGVFNLFVRNEQEVETRNMRYRMRLHSEEGKVYWFDGFKVIKPGDLGDVWHDTSTLYVTLHDGADARAPVLGKGILHIRPLDFMKQMGTMEVPNASSTKERIEVLARFGRFFAGAVWQSYGFIGAKRVKLGDEEALREKRPLEAPAPEVHSAAAEDGTPLQLTRFFGGTKGPVLCVPGFGNTSACFRCDTQQTSFVEYLCAAGYDVWLLDGRMSPDSPAFAKEFDLDDVAHQDLPTASAKVREVTGAETLQLLGHGAGALAGFAALLAGLDRVRSFVGSQMTPHATLRRISDKARLWIEEKLHVDTVPDEIVRSVVEGNLNQATADALDEMTEPGATASFRQIAHSLRAKHLVDADGNDTYLAHVDRLSLPIAVVHGGEDPLYAPEGSQATIDWLRATHGKDLATLHEIPGYGDLDCWIGKEADDHVFPKIAAELDKRNA